MIKNVFFDRDFTLGALTDVRYPDTFEPYADLPAVFAALKADGMKIFIATNQSCIARGTDNGYDYAAEFTRLGADDWFICPHDAGDNCGCRKPKPGLLLAAMEKYRLSPETCVLVGDRKTDVACGKAAGMRTIALLSPATDGDSAADGADGAARSLTEALTVIRRWNADEAAGRKG